MQHPRSLTILTSCALLVVASIGASCAARRGQAGMQQARDPVWRSQLREEAIALLEAAARDESPLIRANALEGLAPLPVRAQPFALDALADSNLGVRFAGAMIAGRIEIAGAEGALRDLLDDPNPPVQAAAIYALTRLGAPVDPSPLARMLMEGDARSRAQAAYILGELGNASAIPMLREAASEAAPNARFAEVRLLNLQIAEALAKLGDPDAIEGIRAALYPSRPEELEAAALAVQIIGEVGDRRSIDQLIYMAEPAATPEDSMPAEVRLAAAASLAELGLPRGDFIAMEYAGDELPAIRAQAAFVFGKVASDRALLRLDAMLDDESPLVAVAAAAAILDALAPEGR